MQHPTEMISYTRPYEMILEDIRQIIREEVKTTKEQEISEKMIPRTDVPKYIPTSLVTY